MDLRQQLLDESDAFTRIYGPTRAPKLTQDEPIPIYMTWGPPSSLLTKDRGKWGQPTVGRPCGGGPRAPPTYRWHVARYGWCSIAVWVDSRANGWWLPPINTRGGAPNEDTHTLHHQQFTLLLSCHLSESCLREFRSRGTQEGAPVMALFSNLYLYKRVWRNQGECRACRHSFLRLYLN